MLVANFKRIGFNLLKLSSPGYSSLARNIYTNSFLKGPSVILYGKRFASSNVVINSGNNSRIYSKCLSLFVSGALFYMIGQEITSNMPKRSLKASNSEESELEETLSLNLDEIYERCAIEFLSNPEVNFTF